MIAVIQRLRSDTASIKVRLAPGRWNDTTDLTNRERRRAVQMAVSGSQRAARRLDDARHRVA